MIAIIPVFFEGDQELWRSPDGRKLMTKFFRSAANAGEIEQLFVLTGDDSTLQLSKSIGIRSYMISANKHQQESQLLPLGTYSSVKYLQDSMKVDFQELMILSFRNPLVTFDSIDEAVTKFRALNKRALISVKKSSDHPCQLNTYYEIIDTGFIHIFDEDREAIDHYIGILDNHCRAKVNTNPRNEYNSTCQKLDNCRSYRELDNHSLSNQHAQWPLDNHHYKLTRPFYFDWGASNITGNCTSGMYTINYKHIDVKYVPLEDALDGTGCQRLSPLWIYENNETARILSSLSHYAKIQHRLSNLGDHYSLAGAALSNAFNPLSSIALEDPQGGQYFLHVDPPDLPSGRGLIKTVPVGLSGPFYKQATECQAADFLGLTPLHHEGCDVCGIIYFLLSLTEDASYDVVEPFPASETLWTISGAKVTSRNGSEIRGRQDFPDVFEPEGTLFITKRDVIQSFDQIVTNGEASGFLMPELSSLQLRTPLDLLRYTAATRAVRG